MNIQCTPMMTLYITILHAPYSIILCHVVLYVESVLDLSSMTNATDVDINKESGMEAVVRVSESESDKSALKLKLPAKTTSGNNDTGSVSRGIFIKFPDNIYQIVGGYLMSDADSMSSTYNLIIALYHNGASKKYHFSVQSGTSDPVFQEVFATGTTPQQYVFYIAINPSGTDDATQQALNGDAGGDAWGVWSKGTNDNAKSITSETALLENTFSIGTTTYTATVKEYVGDNPSRPAA